MRIGGLEAGGTKMVCAVGNEKGEVLERISIPTLTPDETFPEMISYYKEKKLMHWVSDPLVLLTWTKNH